MLPCRCVRSVSGGIYKSMPRWGRSSVEKVRLDNLHFTQNAPLDAPAIIGHTNATLYRYEDYQKLLPILDSAAFGQGSK